MSENNQNFDLRDVDRVVITTLVDNYIDNLLTNTEHVKRATLMKGGVRREPLLAEHGLSFFIEAFSGGERHCILMDFGISPKAMPNNLIALGVDPAEAEAAFLSHGHHDHIGALKEVLGSLAKPIQVYLHPLALSQNRIHLFPDGREVPIPTLKREVVEQTGCPLVEISQPHLLAGGLLGTLTGIPRETSFEKGMPTAHYKIDGKTSKDDILDDQALVAKVKGKGLVIIAGCGHSGIVNTVNFARRLTGEEKIYAVLGGFHLTGPEFEPIIEVTVEAMKQFSPQVIIPCHCTGWKAINRFEQEFPGQFVLNSVGAKIVL
jgi:7,8-dihydropterin-6-yl-methyl-4-(beta-D-ribofuranosyl)aminobenzene 5'-phosphate synthase